MHEYNVSVIFSQLTIKITSATMESELCIQACASKGISGLVTVTKYSVDEMGTTMDCVVSPVDHKNEYSHPIAGLVMVAVKISESLVALQEESISTLYA